MEISTLIIVKDVIVGIAALVGMLFGFYNFYNERKNQKVNLRVIPKIARSITQSITSGKKYIMTTATEFPVNDEIGQIAIEIINRSPFPVTADSVGFQFKGSKDKLIIPEPVIGDQKDWPRKLEPRESVTVYGNFEDLFNHHDAKNIKNAFVATACGETIKGTSKTLKKITKYLKKNT